MQENLFTNLLNTINCDYEVGVWSEITAFMEQKSSQIKNYKLTFDKTIKCFMIDIELKDNNIHEIRNFFNSLVHFIEYSEMTVYFKDTVSNSVNYTLLSSMETQKGFFLKVIFRQ